MINPLSAILLSHPRGALQRSFVIGRGSTHQGLELHRVRQVDL
jgi:hypothetical protein